MKTYTIQINEQQLLILTKAIRSHLLYNDNDIDDTVKNSLGYTELSETVMLSDMMQTVDNTDTLYGFTL